MVRVLVFLVLTGAVAFAASWLADQNGSVSFMWNADRYTISLLLAAMVFVLAVAGALLAWVVIAGLLRLPRRIRLARQARSEARGRDAIARGLIAIGAGDQDAARRHAGVAARHAAQDPLMLMLTAQSAQLAGDRAGAQRAFHAMAERADTRLLGLRGLFIEAQRNDDPISAVAAAEEALKSSPQASWASHAVLGFRCAQGDWTGALAIVDRNSASGAIDKAQYRRQRAVLLTARALELETSDRDTARTLVMDAVKLAPTLIPTAALAAKFLSESQQTRKAMQIIETAWLAQPHPDLADAYAHVRLGDSALERLRRIERLADKTPGHVEGALGIARVAADAREFARARAVLVPLVDAPTQRVALLMAEIERGENDDEGAARAWTLRAVRAALDPAWTADGFVSDRWRPVSPVTGRLDAFQWMVPVAALPPATGPVTDAERTPMIPAPVAPPPPEPEMKTMTAVEPPASVAADSPPPAEEPKSDTAPTAQPAPAAETPVPVFRPRVVPDPRTRPAPVIPAVIPLVRAPDDPGVPDTPDEFTDSSAPAAQAGGVRGFFSRLVR